MCRWYVSDATAGRTKKYYFIVSRSSGLYLDVKDVNRKPGARVIMSTKNGGDNQLWYEDNGRIRSKLNGYCLEVEGKYTMYTMF